MEKNQFDRLTDGERELVSGAVGGDAFCLKTLASRYAPPIFFYILNLSSCGRDAAFEATVSIFTDRLFHWKPEESESFLVLCLRRALEIARTLPVKAAFDLADSDDRLTPERKASRRFLKQALANMTFEGKAFLLLRDQMCLPYSLIGRVHGLEEREARMRVERNRLSLRDALELILRKKEGIA